MTRHSFFSLAERERLSPHHRDSALTIRADVAPMFQREQARKKNLYFEVCAGGTALLFLEKRASFDFTKMVR